MNRLLLLLITCCISLHSSSQSKQQKEEFYLWSNDWKSVTKPEDAAYLGSLVKQDSLWNLCTYRLMGPMMADERYVDKECTELSGVQKYFHKSGYIDSAGEIKNKRLEGEWTYYNDTGRAITKKIYSGGRLVSVEDLLKERDTADDVALLNDDETESSFRGGLHAWQRFLLKNLQYPDRALKGNVMGTVEVVFIVDTDGNVRNPEIYRSVEYSLDRASLSLIKKSPAWQPAVQKGRVVKSFKKQPIAYRFE